MKHFFLTTEPWIPVVDIHGENRKVSLETLFEDGENIADLVLPPGLRIAVTRFLLAIVIRSCPVLDRAEWRLRKNNIAMRATAYLKEWHNAFDLYGKMPFLQAKGLKNIDNATVDKLDFTLASGSNHKLFDHAAVPEGRAHTADEQALLLLLAQNFYPGGTIGPNYWNGVKTNDQTGNISSPALEGSPLHIFLLGKNILETLWLNLIPANELGALEIGVPPWENPPGNATEAQQFRNTLLGRLAPISRAILLPEDGNKTTVAVACNYAQITEFVDPYLANIRREKDQSLSYFRISSAHLFWRDLEGLLWLQTQDKHIMPPKNLQAITVLPPEQELTFWAGGVAVDKAKYVFAGEWRFDFSIETCSSDEFWNYFKSFAKKAETASTILQDQIDCFWKCLGEVQAGTEEHISIRAGKDRAIDFAKNEFWHRVDRLAFECLASNEETDLKDFFRIQENKICHLMQKILDDAMPRTSARHLLAYAQMNRIFRNKMISLMQPHKQQEDNNGTTL